MRPLLLRLVGFRSHASATEISFENRNFIAIVGPTGSGKSSLLDGIAYALYGKTPKVSTGTGRLVCSRSERAKITFRFALDDRVFEINRSIPAASDDHLVEIGSDEKVLGAREIGPRVEELLGLDFDAFGSSVLLAQGRFAKFLESTTSERTKILKGIFRIEQIDELRKAAVGRLTAIKGDLREIEGERKSIPDDVAEQLAAQKKDLSEAEKRIAVLQKAGPEETQITERIKESIGFIEKSEAELARLDKAEDNIPDLESLRELASNEKECVANVAGATEARGQATAALEAAKQQLSTLEEELGSAGSLARLRGRAAGRTGLEEEISVLTERRAALETKLSALHQHLEVHLADETAAEESLARATDAREELQRQHLAHELRTTLAPGEPCPVCEQLVAKPPRKTKVAALDTAGKAVKSAQTGLEKARKAASAAREELAAHRAEAGSLEQQSSDRRAALEALTDELTAVLGKKKATIDEIDRRLAMLEDATQSVGRTQESLDRARAQLERCSTTQRELSAQRARYTTVLVELSTRLDLDAPSADDSAETLARRTQEITEALESRKKDLVAALEKAKTDRDEQSEALVDLYERIGIEEGSVADAIAATSSQIAVSRHRVAELAAKIDRSKELDVREKELRKRHAIFERLAEDLRNETFINFLLEDRRRMLSELASERLRDMTGRYRFDDEGNFDVVDEFDGDRVRDVETLSGGETFLASLALALGLAETATRQGGRLQCFFLDEGFGSLDPESFDLALDGIERIVAPDRLIGLVSHVAPLAARVEDKIVLDKDPEGMTVLVRGGSA